MFYSNHYVLDRYKTKELLLTDAHNGESYAQNLYNIIHVGFQDFMDKNRDVLYKLNATARANTVNSFIQYHAKQFSLADQNANWHVIKRMGVLILFNKIVIRFKKLPAKARHRNKFKSSNIATQQVQDFRNQQLRIGNTASDCVRLDGGFTLDDLGHSILDTLLICPSGEFTKWVLYPSDVTVDKQQPYIFDHEEEELLPVLALKTHVIRKANDRETGS